MCRTNVAKIKPIVRMFYDFCIYLRYKDNL